MTPKINCICFYKLYSSNVILIITIGIYLCGESICSNKWSTGLLLWWGQKVLEHRIQSNYWLWNQMFILSLLHISLSALCCLFHRGLTKSCKIADVNFYFIYLLNLHFRFRRCMCAFVTWLYCIMMKYGVCMTPSPRYWA